MQRFSFLCCALEQITLRRWAVVTKVSTHINRSKVAPKVLGWMVLAVRVCV